LGEQIEGGREKNASTLQKEKNKEERKQQRMMNERKGDL